jgi:hypothetical protein
VRAPIGWRAAEQSERIAIARGEAKTDQRDAAEVPRLQMFAEQARAQNERADGNEKAHAVGTSEVEGNLVRCVAPLDDLEVGKAEDVPLVPVWATSKLDSTADHARNRAAGTTALWRAWADPGQERTGLRRHFPLMAGSSGVSCALEAVDGWQGPPEDCNPRFGQGDPSCARSLIASALCCSRHC